MADDSANDTTAQTVSESQEVLAQPTTPAVAAEPADDGNFVRVPSEHLQAYGGDFHRALGDAKIGRQMTDAGANELMAACSDLGVTPKELAQSIRATDGTTPPEGPQPTGLEAPTEPEQAPLTMDGIRTAMHEVVREDRQDSDDAAAEQAVQNFALQTIQGEGLNFNEDGSVGVLMQQAWNMLHSGIHQAKAAELPSWASDQEKADAMKRPASETARQTAAAEFKKTFADLRNEINSAAVTQQQDMPGATHGTGPAGAPPTKPWNEMTAEERKAHVMGVVEEVTG